MTSPLKSTAVVAAIVTAIGAVVAAVLGKPTDQPLQQPTPSGAASRPTVESEPHKPGPIDVGGCGNTVIVGSAGASASTSSIDCTSAKTGPRQ